MGSCKKIPHVLLSSEVFEMCADSSQSAVVDSCRPWAGFNFPGTLYRFLRKWMESGRAAVPILRHTDPRLGLACVTAALVSFGMIMIFGVSAVDPGGSMRLDMAAKQAVSVFIGIVGLLAARRIDYHALVRGRWVILGLAVAALSLVLVPGVGSKLNGARRWFLLGFVSVQPSEFAKIALIIFLAGFLSKIRQATELLRGFLPVIAAILVVCLLIQAEPDFGTAVLTAVVGFSMLFVAGTKLLHMLALAGVAVPVLWAALMSAPYRVKRFMAFLDPWADPRGAGYHTIQSLIAVGSGGLFGVGIGRSSQKLQYLPSAYSDFMFAIVAEETGHLGCLVLIGLFLFFLWCAIKICREAVDDTGFFLSFGIITSIVLQGTINIAVVTASLPAKGLPLPFVSFGGSNLVALMVTVGILLNIADHSAHKANCSE